MKKYSIGIYEKAFPEDLSIVEMLQLSKLSGYDFFEISIDRTDKRIERIYDSEFADMLVCKCKELDFRIMHVGLSAIGVYTLGNPDHSIREKGIDIFKNTVAFANKIGACLIQIPACDMPKFDNRSSETDKLYISTLKEMVEFAALQGIVVAIENMENDYMDTIEKCMRIVKQVNSPYLQLYPDSGNIMSAACMYGNSPTTDMGIGKGHYVAFHLKETKPGRYGGLFYGEGHVDFKQLVNKAWELGVRRYVMEYWYTGNPAWEEDLIIARNNCISWLEECTE